MFRFALEIKQSKSGQPMLVAGVKKSLIFFELSLPVGLKGAGGGFPSDCPMHVGQVTLKVEKCSLSELVAKNSIRFQFIFLYSLC